VARLWDATRGGAMGAAMNCCSSITALELSPDGKTLATGSKDGTLQLWSGTTGAPQSGSWTNHTGSVVGISFGPRRGRLATASLDGTAMIWSIKRKGPDR
jgi:WD40 repeat protein